MSNPSTKHYKYLKVYNSKLKFHDVSVDFLFKHTVIVYAYTTNVTQWLNHTPCSVVPSSFTHTTLPYAS